MFKKCIAITFAVLLAACSNPQGPSPVPDQTPVVSTPAVGATSPAPTPPVTAPPGPEHNAQVKGGFYTVTNETGIPQFYCAAAFGVTPGGAQGAGSNLFEDQGVRNNGDVFSGQAPKTAACQYEQIQVDLTQSKDCRNFDWSNVLAAEVYKNPSYIEGSKKSKLEELAYSEWTVYGPWSGQECGTRTRTRKVYEQYKYDCSGEVVRVEVRTETDTQTKDCCAYPSPSFQLSALSFPTYTPAVPAVKVGGYLFGNNSNGNRDACEDNGGTWHHSLKFCQITKHFGSTWDDDENLPGKDEPQSDGSWQDSFTITAAVAASGGNPISGTATVSGAGVWKLILRATDPGNYEKNVKSVTLTCNSQPATLTVSYNWVGHDSEKWKLELYRDNVLVQTSAVVNNPSN